MVGARSAGVRLQGVVWVVVEDGVGRAGRGRADGGRRRERRLGGERRGGREVGGVVVDPGQAPMFRVGRGRQVVGERVVAGGGGGRVGLVLWVVVGGLQGGQVGRGGHLGDGRLGVWVPGRVQRRRVHHLAHLVLLLGDGVGELGLLVPGGRHALVMVRVAGHRRRVGAVQAGLDQRFARLRRDHGLQLPGGEGVDVARLGGDQQHHLGPRQRGQLVRLWGDNETG